MALAARPGPAAELITLSEAARLAGVHRDTVRAWCARGELPSSAPGRPRELRLRRSDLERLLDDRAAAPDPRPARAKRQRNGAGTADGIERRAGAARRRRAARTRCAASPPSCPAPTRSSRSSRRSSTTPMRLFHADRAGLWLWHPKPEHPARARAPSRDFPDAIERAGRAPRPQDSNLAGFEALRRETVHRLPRRRRPGDHAGDARAVRGKRHRRRCASCPAVFRGDAARPARPVPQRPVRLDAGGDRARPQLRRHDRDGHRQCPAHGLRRGPRRAAPGDPGPVGPALRHPGRPRHRRHDRGRGARADRRTTRSASTASTTTPAGASRSPSRACSWAAPIPSPSCCASAIGEGLTGWVAEHGETLLLGDAHDGPAEPDRRRDDRPRVDARRPDDLRGPRPRHRRRRRASGRTASGRTTRRR